MAFGLLAETESDAPLALARFFKAVMGGFPSFFPQQRRIIIIRRELV